MPKCSHFSIIFLLTENTLIKSYLHDSMSSPQYWYWYSLHGEQQIDWLYIITSYVYSWSECLTYVYVHSWAFWSCTWHILSDYMNIMTLAEQTHVIGCLPEYNANIYSIMATKDHLVLWFNYCNICVHVPYFRQQNTTNHYNRFNLWFIVFFQNDNKQNSGFF